VSETFSSIQPTRQARKEKKRNFTPEGCNSIIIIIIVRSLGQIGSLHNLLVTMNNEVRGSGKFNENLM
jgi:hypothetical protein